MAERMRQSASATLRMLLLAVLLACVATAGLPRGAHAVDAESALTQVQQRGTLRVAVMAGNQPWTSVQPDGSLAGYEIDIANMIGKALGVKVEFVRTDVAGRVASLQAHKADMTIATFTPTLQRLTTLAFTDAYALDGIQILVRGDSGFTTLADMNKPSVQIGLARGSTSNTMIAQYLPNAKVVQLTSQSDLLQALESKQVDLVAANNGLMAAAAKSSSGKYMLVGPLMGEEADSIGLQADDFRWWLWLNSFVHQINADGSNYTLYKKWFETEPPAFIKPPAQVQ